MMHKFRLFVLVACLWLFSAAHAQMITLNFKDMDLKLLIDTISRVTKKTFIIDPVVLKKPHKINIVSTQPMTKKQVYEVFLSILNVHGLAAITSGSVIKIVPEQTAKQESTPVLTQASRVSGDELITQVVKVEHISAAQLVPLLRPLIPNQGHLVAYPQNNTLIISDRSDNIRRLMKIIKRVDRESEDKVEVVLLEHASANEVVRILKTLSQQANNDPAKIGAGKTLSMVADERTNSVLISGDPSTRLHLRTLISHLDTPLKTSGNTKVIYIRYAQAKDLVNVLKGVSESLANQQSAVEGKKTAGDAPQLGLKTNIQADESTNSLIITATPDVLKDLESVVRQLDVRRAQVLVEAIIAEIEVDKSRELGVQWILDGGSGGAAPVGLFNTGGQASAINLLNSAIGISNGTTSSIPDLGQGAFLGLGRLNPTGFSFGLLLKALSADTSTNVLSTPSLMTLDNQEAEITVGQNVPFVTGQYTNTGANNGATTPFQTIQREDVGIKLKVKPQINEGSAVQLDIEQEISSLTKSTIATSDIVTNKRTIKTSVIIEDGSMIVLGGLLSEDLQQVAQRVPGLGDIPIMGNLFKSESTQKTKRNLMIFLHPTIIRNAADERSVSQGKYSYMRAKQLQQRKKGAAFFDEEDVPVLPDLNEFLTVLPDKENTLMPVNIGTMQKIKPIE